MNKNLFGEEIVADELLRDKFLIPPFSVFDTKSGDWLSRRRKWQKLGIQSELGRTARAFNMKEWMEDKAEKPITQSDISIFDPVLCEINYRWFCPTGGIILDPFAGGSVRGIVAAYLGYQYYGIELRAEQVTANREQAGGIFTDPAKPKPTWYAGDSEIILNEMGGGFADMIFSCPPYFDLEIYSDDPADISAMTYVDFLNKYHLIIGKSVQKLKPDSFAVFVVGDVRDDQGFYRDLIVDTKLGFQRAGMKLYNEAILLNSIGTAAMRAEGNMVYRKLAKTHQNVLIFYKGNPKAIKERLQTGEKI